MIALVIMTTLVTADPHCENLPAQAQMNRCSASRAADAGAAMTREWNRTSAAMKRLDRDPEASHAGSGSYFSALLASQRAWLKFREAECRIEGYANRGGTLQPMTESDCYADVTNGRTRQLRDLRASFGQ